MPILGQNRKKCAPKCPQKILKYCGRPTIEMAKMKDYICQKCTKRFVSKRNLSRHVEFSCKGVADGKSFMCSYCLKCFSRDDSLKRHQDKCSSKIKKETTEAIMVVKDAKISDLESINEILRENLSQLEKQNVTYQNELVQAEKKISELKGIIQGMKSAPARTTYQTLNIQTRLDNLPISFVPALEHDYISTTIENMYTYEMAKTGMRGITTLVMDLIEHTNENGEIERNYVCTDTSRNTFYRLLKQKKWWRDKGGQYINDILDHTKSAVENHYQRAYSELDKYSYGTDEYERCDAIFDRIGEVRDGIMGNPAGKKRMNLARDIRHAIRNKIEIGNIEEIMD